VVTDIVVVGAGPYGLSIGAHLAGLGADFRIFGTPLATWREHMPRGMLLKSDGFASSLSAPAPDHTLAAYCASRGIDYDHLSVPVRLDTFLDYGLDFQRRFAPMLETRSVERLEAAEPGYRITLDDGQIVLARRVVLAVGITHFHQTPEVLAGLPCELSTHSSAHADVSRFRGRDVTVIGAGSSAVDLALHLAEAGATARLVARKPTIRFGSRPTGKPRSRWSRIRHPTSGLGPGLRSRLFSDAPDLFRRLPAAVRLEIVRRHLGPSSPWHLRDAFEAKVETLTGQTLAGAEAASGRVRLRLASEAGEREIETDHVIAATGYRADLGRLQFIAPELRRQVRTLGAAPALSSGFESTAPGLHFVGNAAAVSFGPLMRFMFGAEFAARRVSRRLVR
jgi:hypothetical protein